MKKLTLVEWFAAAAVLAAGVATGWALRGRDRPPPDTFVTIVDDGDGGLHVWIDPRLEESYLRRREMRADKDRLPEKTDFSRLPGDAGTHARQTSQGPGRLKRDDPTLPPPQPEHVPEPQTSRPIAGGEK